jgi:hypothetical protein
VDVDVVDSADVCAVDVPGVASVVDVPGIVDVVDVPGVVDVAPAVVDVTGGVIVKLPDAL